MLAKLRKEIIHAIPAIIYFLLTFNFIHFIAGLARQPGDVRYYTTLGVSVFALVVGKVIILVNCFSFINAFPKKPLIYNIIWKLFIYNFFILVVRILEIFSHEAFRFKNIHLALEKILYNLSLPMFWSTEFCLVFIFLGYIIASEFVRVLGKKEVIKLIFG